MERFETRVHAGSSPASLPAREVESDVFLEVFGNTSEVMDSEYGPYDSASVFVSVSDVTVGRVVGMVRLIVPGPAGLKSLVDLAREPWCVDYRDVVARTCPEMSTDLTFDVASLAVVASHRGRATGGVVARALYQGLVQVGLDSGLTHVVAIADMPVYEMARRSLHGFRPYVGVEAGSYLDSPSSLPVWDSLASWSASMRAGNERLHEHVFGGEPFSMVSIPEQWGEWKR